MHMTRRNCLLALPAGAATLWGLDAQADEGTAATGTLHAEFPSQDPALVREVVGASHGRIDRVRELVEGSPALARASWDWGFGDWESALGAASHMGRRDIAELLIAHGARPNLFTLVMLGKLEAVKSTVESMPGIQKIPGPHGITLLQHAKHGGEQAQSVVAYLEALGDADIAARSLEVTAAQHEIYVGTYTFGSGPDDRFEVLVNSRGSLAIKRGDRFSRVLLRVEDHGFAPGGAEAVRVRFKVEQDKAVALTIHDPTPLCIARRSG